MNTAEHDSFSELLKSAGGSSEWTKPTEFDFSSDVDRLEAERRIQRGAITHVHDAIDVIADDLFELRNPDKKRDELAREGFTRRIGALGLGYGRWFHFQWDNSLVRYPEIDDLRDLRTFRNKLVITDSEQDDLYESTVAVMGLSVGSSIVDQLTMSGIGGTQVLADYDTLAPSNLNRIRADFSQVGMSKIDIAAQKISKTDPYINQIHFREGINHDVLEQLEAARPGVIYDEIDDLAMKALIRRFAARQRIPVIMATDVGDTSIIDVERYDISKPKAFNGRISETEVDALINGEVDERHKSRLRTKLVGVKNASPRLLDSALHVDTTLAGLPQLGTTATIGGSLAAVAGREILIGRKVDNGRFVSSMKETLQLQSQTDLKESVRILRKFLATSRS